MVPTRFSWPYGGHQVFLSGSFSRWMEHYQMSIVEGSSTVFQVVCSLPPGFHQDRLACHCPKIECSSNILSANTAVETVRLQWVHVDMEITIAPLCFTRAMNSMPNAKNPRYRFMVDGTWRYDEQQLCITDDYGTVNNVVLVRDLEPSILQHEAFPRTMILGVGGPSYMVPSSSGMHHESAILTSEADIEVFRNRISTFLSSHTVYDMLPISSKVSIMDAQMPVKEVFHIMYDEGLPVAPIWDDSRGQVVGMLTASDFILILREMRPKHLVLIVLASPSSFYKLQHNISMLANEELELHSVSAWKEGKVQVSRVSNGPVGPQRRSLIHAFDHECLKDVALKIVRSEISSVPVLKSSMQDGSCLQLLNLTCLSGILKYICRHYRELTRSMPLLQLPISRIPLGTWKPEINGGNGQQLTILRHNAPLSYTLNLLLEARISSIPIVDDNGSLVDVYSRSDIIALAKGNAYARIQLDQMTMDQALDQVYLSNPVNTSRRQCPTCLCSSSLHEVMEQLSDPAVRRLVVVEAGSRHVQGIISLRDVFKFLIG